MHSADKWWTLPPPKIFWYFFIQILINPNINWFKSGSSIYIHYSLSIFSQRKIKSLCFPKLEMSMPIIWLWKGDYWYRMNCYPGLFTAPPTQCQYKIHASQISELKLKFLKHSLSQHTERQAQGEFHKCTLNLFNSILNLEQRWNALTHSLASLSRSKVFLQTLIIISNSLNCDLLELFTRLNSDEKKLRALDFRRTEPY